MNHSDEYLLPRGDCTGAWDCPSRYHIEGCYWDDPAYDQRRKQAAIDHALRTEQFLRAAEIRRGAE